MTDYINSLLCECAPEDGDLQDAIERAIVTGAVNPSGHLAVDKALVLDQLDAIQTAHQRARQAQYSRTLDAMAALLPGDLGESLRRAA